MGRKSLLQPQPLATLLVLAAFSLSACATGSMKASSPDPFVKEWAGTWHSSTSPATGEVELNVMPAGSGDNRFTLFVRLTNSRFPSWSVPAIFKDGVLVVNQATLQMELRLLADGGLGADYDVTGGDRGSWRLAPKQK